MSDDKKIDETIDELLAANAAEEKAIAPRKKIRAKATEEDVDNAMELSAEEQADIEAEVRAEIAKELKADKRKAYFELKKAELKKKALFKHGKDEEGENTEAVFIALAPHAPFIRLDNNIYYPNRIYRLGQKKASTIKEIMYRTWLHDHEISGQDMNAFYGKQARNQIINPANAGQVMH